MAERGDSKLRWRVKLRAPPSRATGEPFHPVEGYYVWLVGGTDEAASWDPIYAQRLAFLDHHPGFASDIVELRRTEQTPEAIVAVAAKWQITAADLLANVEDRQLDDAGDKIFVELHPTEFVLRIPRPLTSARREAVKRWLIETHSWPWLRESTDGSKWQSQGDAHVAPEAVARLDWYDRWQAGERPAEIAASVPLGRIAEETVRTTLQRIHKQLKRISPDGLKTPGP